MSRSRAFQQLARAVRVGLCCDRLGISTSDGLERFAAKAAEIDACKRSLREFLAGISKRGALGAVAATQVKGKYLAHLQHGPSDPLVRGSYTCNQPGYFTTMVGHEATPVGNLYFAGEHTDQFCEWQGFM